MTWLTRTPGGIDVERRPYGVANCGRTWTVPGAAPRVTLHTTESRRGSIDAVLNLWDQAERNGTLTVPHFTIDAGPRRIVQHRDMLGPACALEGCGDGRASTNGVPNVQVEICGYATESPGWSDDDLAFIGDWLAAVRAGGFDVPLASPVTFYSDRNAPYVLASYSSPNRIGAAAWYGTAGVIGHQHVPCNAHWDPGGVNVGRILYHAALALGGPTNGKELTVADIKIITDQIAALSAQVAQMQSTLGGWMQGERIYDGLVPVKTADDPRQFLVVIVPGKGYARVHLTGEAKGVLQKQQTIQAGVGGFDGGHPVDFVTLTDPAQVAWFKSLPVL